MKKLMIAMGAAALLGAVHAEDTGIVSSDIVGYTTKSITAGQFYLLGAQFEGVGEDGVAGLNSAVQTSGISPVLYDATDDAARIDVLTADASGYISYYYISDADDGTERYDLTGWADGDGFIVDESTLALGKGFWFHVPAKTASGTPSFTVAGQVANDSDFTLEIPSAGTFAILSNPYPTAIDLSKVTTTGITPVLYDETDNAARIDVLTADASGYISYYYISDADDGTERYDLTGWADGDGFIVDEAVIEAGAAFWVRSPTGGSLKFSL